MVALGGTKEDVQFREAKEFFGKLKTPERDVNVVWVEGPRFESIFEEIQNKEIPTGHPGKRTVSVDYPRVHLCSGGL